MRSKKYLTLTLILSLMVSVMTLRAESTQPSPQALMPESLQVSTLYTEEEVVVALKVGIKAALDAAIPLAVQAAVAEERGKTAAAQSLADSWREEYKKAASRRLGDLAIGAGVGIALTIVVVLLTR
jgi:hypothetical protein